MDDLTRYLRTALTKEILHARISEIAHRFNPQVFNLIITQWYMCREIPMSIEFSRSLSKMNFMMLSLWYYPNQYKIQKLSAYIKAMIEWLWDMDTQRLQTVTKWVWSIKRV